LESFAGWSQADQIWPGLGSWLFAGKASRSVRQLKILQGYGFSGEMFFSDDALSESQSLLEALAAVPVNP
ncbi:MAG: hypothetical protein VCB25_04270, partial [Myxococcota bacterium]